MLELHIKMTTLSHSQKHAALLTHLHQCVETKVQSCLTENVFVKTSMKCELCIRTNVKKLDDQLCHQRK